MNKTILIVIGLACAVIGAVGIMWYSSNTPRNQVIKYYNKLLVDIPNARKASAVIRVYSHGIYEPIESRKTIDEAIIILGRYNIKESIPAMRKLLKDKNTAIRTSAMCALSDMRDKESIPEIRKLLNDKNEEVISCAISVLGQLGDKESIPEIRKLANCKGTNDDQESVRGSAVSALGDLKDEESIPLIRELLKDKDLRRFAIYTLVDLEGKEAIPLIKELLKDKDSSVSGAARYNLEILGLTEDEINEAQFKGDIDRLFNDFMNEKFIAPRSPICNGWEMTLPSGKGIVRSMLQEQADQIIAYGTEAVPYLFRWLKIDNLPVRYIAIYSLQQITGVTPDTPIFASEEAEKDSKDIEEAIVVWQEWYDNRKKK